MAGKIRTREVCPQCSQKFHIIEETDIFCVSCKTRPRTFYIYLYWPDPQLGRDHKITHAGGEALDSFRRAKRLLEKIRSEIDSRTFILRNYLAKKQNALTGDKLFPRWLAFIREKKRALSYTVKLRQYIDDHFLPRFGDADCSAIRTNDITSFRSYLMGCTIKKTGRPLSPKTVKNILDQLKSFCKWLLREEIISRMPIFDSVDVPEALPVIMPLEDRRKALAAVSSPFLRPALTFYALHPIRPSEIAALDVRHFDLEYRCVRIEHGLDYDGSVKDRKNKKQYVIPLSDQWDASCIRGRFGREIAFPNKEGRRYNAHTLNEAWKTACRRAKVPYVNLYNAMKHTTMTEKARLGASRKQLEMLAGQSTPGMSDKYVALSVESIRHLVDAEKLPEVSGKYRNN